MACCFGICGKIGILEIMQVPMIQSGETPHISVWLSDEQLKIEKYFHCCVCGKILFSYFDRVNLVVVGGMPLENSRYMWECKGKTWVPNPQFNSEKVVREIVKDNHVERYDFYNEPEKVSRLCKTIYYVN